MIAAKHELFLVYCTVQTITAMASSLARTCQECLDQLLDPVDTALAHPH